MRPWSGVVAKYERPPGPLRKWRTPTELFKIHSIQDSGNPMAPNPRSACHPVTAELINSDVTSNRGMTRRRIVPPESGMADENGARVGEAPYCLHCLQMVMPMDEVGSIGKFIETGSHGNSGGDELRPNGGA